MCITDSLGAQMEVVRRASRLCAPHTCPGVALRQLGGLAWSSWEGLNAQQRSRAVDRLHHLLRFLSSGSPDCTLEDSCLTALRQEIGPAAWRWPSPLDRESAFEVVTAVADARARACWQGASHAD